jgi:tRNA(Ile)-lysidine synthase TilS/MesJ
MVRGAARRHSLPVVHNPCPADGNTRRQEVKELVARLSGDYPRLKDYVFGSMQRLPLPAWEPEKTVSSPSRPFCAVSASSTPTCRRGMEDGDAE